MSGMMKEIGAPIERKTPDPAHTGPDYYVVGQLGEQRPPPDIDRRGPFAPSRLFRGIMTGPSPHTEQTAYQVPEPGADSFVITEQTRYLRGEKPYMHSHLHQVARVALWATPVALAGGAALGYWLGKRAA